MLRIDDHTPVGSFVAEDYRTSLVFKKYGIDYCCKGGIPLEQACSSHGVELAVMKEELEKATREQKAGGIDVSTWPLDLLADYIEKKHHRYVEERIPALRQNLDKLVMKHGVRFPELSPIRELFYQVSDGLTIHMKKEELILFPFIRKMCAAERQGLDPVAPPFGKVENPVSAMKQDHEDEGERFHQIALLTHQYTAPENACTTHRVTYDLLREFEEDLHFHIHLENNILFPATLHLEQRLFSQH